MRLRNDPNIDEKIAALSYLADSLEKTEAFLERLLEKSVSWADYFGNDNPICLEIGMGKGTFIEAMSRTYPEVNFIGIDLRKELLYEAGLTIGEERSNVALLVFNAIALGELFRPGELERIYLNFSDPWPKKRHGKRRLTHKNFLDVYRPLLKDGGEILVRTDHRDLFDFTVESMAENGFCVEELSYDFHKSEYFDGIMTEYERKKSPFGPIHYGRFRKI